MKPEKQPAAKKAPLDSRLSCMISTEAHQRLIITGMMKGETMSQVVNRVILANCREYSMPGYLGDRASRENSADLEADVKHLGSSAAN